MTAGEAGNVGKGERVSVGDFRTGMELALTAVRAGDVGRDGDGSATCGLCDSWVLDV